MKTPTKCTGCGAKIDLFDTFPGNICVVCHAKKVDSTPLPTDKDMIDAWGLNTKIFNVLTK